MTGRMPRYGQAFLLPNGSIAPVWYDYLRTLDASSLTAEIERQVQANTEAIKALQQAGFGDYLPASAYVLGINSVETFGDLADGTRVLLRGDVPAPDPTTYYGADQDQERGFHPISGAIEAEAGELTKDVAADGVTTFGLDDVTPAPGGTLQSYGFDAKGRRVEEGEATTDDLPEGSTNLYFTDARADARVDAGIAEHVAQPDPHPQYATASEAAAAAPVQSVNGKQGAVQLGAADVGAVAAEAFAPDLLQPASDYPNNSVSTGGTSDGRTHLTGRSTGVNRVLQLISSGHGANQAQALSMRTHHNVSGWSAEFRIPLLENSNDFVGELSVGGSNFYADPLLPRIGVGTRTPGYGLHVTGPTAGIYVSRTHATQEPFFALISNDDPATGGQWRGLMNGGFRATSSDSSVRYFELRETYSRCGNDGAASLGTANVRWSNVYSVNGAINTSDAREKDNIRELTPVEIACAVELAAAGRIYQWNEALAEKGDSARLHCSPTVQSVITIMESHGLDPFRYGFVCFDEWDETPEVRDEETGEVTQEYRPACDRYSLRPSELAHFVMRGLANRQDELEARLSALEE